MLLSCWLSAAPRFALAAPRFALAAPRFGLAAPRFGLAATQSRTAAADSEGFGPLVADPPTGTTPDAIVAKMGARESAFALARQNYIYRQSVVFQTISEDTNRPDGEYRQVTDITFNQAGRREEHVVFAPQNTVERVIMTPSDFRDIEQRLPFVLTAEELPEYVLTYLGRQKVDELDTYVFDVKPKTLVKGKRYFQGKVWVDQIDFQIVLINGLNVPQDMRRGHEDLSPPFTTYYQQVDGKYWFPTYTKAEGNLHFAASEGALSQDIHVRTVVKYTDYKRFRSTVTIHYNGEELPAGGNTPDAPQPPKVPAPPK